MNTRKTFLRASLCAALMAVAGGAQATLMSDLINGGSITVNDKRFDQWTVTQNGPVDGGGIPVALNTLNVTGIDSSGDADPNNPGPGLNFAFNPGHSVTGDGLFAYTDLTFSFRVTVTDPNMRVKDNTLALTGSSLVYTADGSNDLGVFIEEKVGTAPGLSDLAFKKVTNNVLDDVSTQTLTNNAAFAGQSQIFVTKNILVWAADQGDNATLISFQQRFSQERVSVPEPASLLLFGIGLAALVRRRPV